jgi:hypothetical protein
MNRLATRPIRFALAALTVGGLAAAVAFTPARAMVERGALPGFDRHPAISDASAKPSGVISVQVVAGLDGPPPPAARFYGSVSSAQNGATITALSGKATCGTATVAGSSYSLDITSSDTSCTSAGSTVHFLINGKSVHSAGNTAIPEVSAAVHSDLSAP